ncbi:T9SS type A sorting domain-containing protein [candidate division TA06 bacterium]|uniref:Aminopeptidase N n=1 Tax=candidate division TA06 bacterium TaxID=2250710 RepID=A0A933I6Y9_UNCT6|nr:T9SS type A sorting domain-containing protein [candidate division TA06 bacterium]
MRVIKTILVLLTAAAPALAQMPLETKPAPDFLKPRAGSAKFDSVHQYDVLKYRLAVDLPMTNDSLYGHQNILAVKKSSSDSLTLDCVRLEVDSVKLNGSHTGFLPSADTLYLMADYASVAVGDSFDLEVFYRGGNFSKNGGRKWGYYWYPKGYDANTLHASGYTMSEPQDARAWMPCFDEPWDKADSGCSISITIPDSLAAASNGLLQDTLRSGDRLTWRWREDSAITTYLMCFTASRFSIWSDTVYTVSGKTIPLNYFVWPEDSALSQTVFATVPQMTRLYDSLFHPYPFGKYGMAAVYPFAYGGMEHQAMTTIHRSWITNNSQRGIVHELAHMWFGDLITCGTWADIWLNEGFASYLEAVYDEWLNSRLPGIYMNQYFWRALTGNANIYPIYNPPPNLLFDYSMVYTKGAWVLQGLRWVMGDTVFFPMMRAYADSFANGNVVTADFQRIAEQHYGSTLDWYFAQWVYRAGHPKYYLVGYHKTHPDSNGAKLLIKQTSATGELYKMPVAIVDSSSAGALDTFRVWIQNTDTVIIGDYLNSIEWFKFDPDSWILKELYDSLPVLSNLSTGTKKYGNSLIDVYWRKFRMDSACAGYNVYRADNAAGPFARINFDIIADTMFSDTTTYSGSEYYYAVTAVSSLDTCYETRHSNVLSIVAGGVGSEPDNRELITDLGLNQNVPNPFKQSTMINYQLTKPGLATLKVYNIQGQAVKTLVNSIQSAGRHQAQWDGRDAAGNRASSGIYFVKLEAEGKTITRSLQYIK